MTTSSLGALVTGVDHVGIAVADLDEAIAWYADTLGLVATHTETNEEQGVREAMLSAPGDAGAAIQLLAPLRPDSPIGKFLDRNGPGLQQLAYRVTDIDAACSVAAGQGRAAALRRAAPRHGELPDQLRAPARRRRRAGGARRTRRSLRADLTP